MSGSVGVGMVEMVSGCIVVVEARGTVRVIDHLVGSVPLAASRVIKTEAWSLEKACWMGYKEE